MASRGASRGALDGGRLPMTYHNAIFLAGAITLYLAVGLVLAKLDARERREPLVVSMIFFWFIGIDIRVKYWFVIRAIERNGKRQLVEVERERDQSLRVISLQHEEPGITTVIISLYEEVSTWRGSGLTWYCVESGALSSVWLAARLRQEETRS